MNQQAQALEILNQVGAVLVNDHFVYTSGKHGSAYVNKDAVYPYPERIASLCSLLATNFVEDCIDVVIGPAIGGVIMAQWTTYFLSMFSGNPIALYAEKGGETEFTPTLHKGQPFGLHGKQGFIIGRGYGELIKNKNVLVVEDVINTGGSTQSVIKTVRVYGGYVVGVGCLCNRGGVKAEDLDVAKLVSLVDVNLDAWDADECPLCRDGIPINTTVGKGKDFVSGSARAIVPPTTTIPLVEKP